MKTDTKCMFKKAVTSVALLCMVMQPAYALNLATQPLFIGAAVPPQVMLTISKDQQLYKKAYNDYSDLDGDGAPETTYKHSVRYYGYFDPVKCYSYDVAAGQYEPALVYMVSGVPANALCSGQWSGNFLNWAAMSRMDAVRKLLYGGFRKTDTATATVLERAYLPTDAHAWAKYYGGADIDKLTPFNGVLADGNPTFSDERTQSGNDFTIPNANGDYNITFRNALTYVKVGDQLRIERTGNSAQYVIGAVMAISGNTLTLRINTAGVGGAGVTDQYWRVTNLSSTGISFCNLTPSDATAANQKSQTNVLTPRLRVAKGNFTLWNANEVFQCQWSESRNNLQSGFGGIRSNGNLASLSEINASAENPSQTAHGLGTGVSQGEFNVRINVCVANTALHGTEKCKAYPSGNYKPIGLLQLYGDTGQINFGLMTGSYAKNISGGVLRKNVGTFTDEVEVGTNGTFKAAVGIVRTLDKMRIYGYDYSSGTYLGAAGDNCTYQLTSITENSCTSWGNPMSEIYFEAIRYFAAKVDNQASANYTFTLAGSKDNTLGLPLPAWKAPISQANVCSRLNVLVFNASVSSNDDDLRGTLASDINSTRTIKELTDAVGATEAINGNKFFIGKLTTDSSASAGFELCTAKTVSTLGDVSGICPEGPTLGGSYLIAGLAQHARANRIRNDLDPKTSIDALRVTSYGIQLATNTPQLVIAVPGKPGQSVIIQPQYRLDLGSGNFGGGALVDMKYVRTATTATTSTGKVYINWEDSEQGGDYDQDMWGTLEWVLDASANTLKITTNAISASTANPQGFGYTLSGTTKDGPHFHSGILGFNFTDTVTAQPANFAGCSNCQIGSVGSGQRGAQTVTYTLSAGASTANTLNDPLWYLAKYGGYKDVNLNGQFDPGEWDVENRAGGPALTDGVPDAYFLVTNPLLLENSLQAALDNIAKRGSASSVAANSSSLKTGAAIYKASFDSTDWSGRLLAFGFDSTGREKALQDWDASTKLPTPDQRVILTYLDDGTRRKGVPFRWPADPANLTGTDIGANLIKGLNTSPYDNVTLDALGSDRLKYLRGDASREGATTNLFRTRSSKLGDIANSTPAFVPAVPDAVILDPSYKTFREQFLTTPRTPMLYVGANDGMLHGFDATAGSGGGTERLAYVPSKTFTNLNQLTRQNYVHRYYVDGSPTVADAQVNSNWATVLVGSLGGGGRGIYALDVTTPPPLASDTTNATELAASSKVLWEFNVEDDVPASGAKFGLGYVLGQPVIRKMANGKWAAIVSGGYNNPEAVAALGAGDGKAYIYIIFLDGPKGNSGRTWQPGIDYIRLDTGTGTVAAANGLATPFAADVNADGKVDFIYAGDLRGDFWKFDVSKADQTLWPAVTNRVALFSGGATQPITTAAQGVLHPIGPGFILTFGTGKYLEPTDPIAAASAPFFANQSFYGIWDKNNGTTSVSTQTVVTTPGTQLFKQTINTATVNGVTFRYITGAGGAKGPDWTLHLGWYMDFPDSVTTGERLVFDPAISARRLLFTTLIPSGSACDFGGNGYLMVVNPATGGIFDAPVLDANGDGVLTAADTVSGSIFASGVQTAGISMTPTVLTGGVWTQGRTETTLLREDGVGRVKGGGNRRNTMIVPSVSGTSITMVLGAGPDSGRATWREVIKK